MTHILKLPKERQMVEYRRRSLRIVEGNAKTTLRQPIEPGEELYDALIEKSEGYAGAVPANHKSTVADELMGLIRRHLAEDEESPEA